MLQMSDLNLAQTRNITKVIYALDDIESDLLDYLELSVSIESNSTHTILNISDVLISPYSNPNNTLVDYKSFINGTYSNQTNLLDPNTNQSVVFLNTTVFENRPSLSFTNSNSSLNLRYGYNNLSKNEMIINGSNLLRNYSLTMSLNEICLNNDCANATWAGGPPNVDSSTRGMWHFDESSGMTASDSSGNGNTGLYTGTPHWVGGKFNGGLQFTGDYESMDVNDSNSLDISGSLTVELWFKKFSGTGVYAWLVNKCNYSGTYTTTNYAVWIDGPSNKLRAGIANGTVAQNVTSTSAVQPNTSYHVAFTADGTTLKLYINGVLDNSSSQSMNPGPNNNNLTFGALYRQGGFYFNGTIDEVAIYSRAKSAEEIAADANFFHWDWGPIAMNRNISAAWHFDEGSGTTISDSSGNGNTGSFSTTGSFPVWAAGRFGYGVSFDPAYASNIVAGDSPSLDISGPITVEAWFSAYYLYYSHGHWLLNKGSSSSDGNYHIWIDNTYKVHAAIGNGTDSQAVISASTLQPDTWYHVAFTANGTTDSNGVLKLYINGILDNSSVQTMTPLSNGLDLVIGSMTDTILSYPLNGTIDEIAISSRAKTADEIAADANPLHISLDVRDALNNSVNVRGASSGYVNPTANNTFYLKTDDAGSLNMTAGAYSGFYSLRLHVNNTKVNLLLKTVQEGVSSIQVVIPVELRIYQQLFPNLIVTGK